jgi:hypothetical protein
MITAAHDDFLRRELEEVYRAKAHDHLTSHQLADFRRCPTLYHKKKLGLVADEDRPAYVIGRAVHALALEGGRVFEERYAIGGPINPKTGSPFGANTKAYAEWAEAQGKPVLTDAQFELVTRLAGAVQAHEAAQRLFSAGIPEGVARIEYAGEACQSRLDWFSAERGIVDLKTCDDLSWFEADARRYGYAHQMAFYRAVVHQITGETFPVHIVAVEKCEPFRCGIWRMGEDVLGIAQKENEEAIARLQQCRRQDRWPTLYEDIRVFDWL